jgi:hypothetical protein
LAWLVAGIWAAMSLTSFRSGAGRRWSRAVPMSAMPGRRRMVRGPARFTEYQGRRGGGCAVVESRGRGSSACAQQWRGSGSGVTREGELCVRPTMVGRRRSDDRTGAGCLLFYMRPSKAVRTAPLHQHVRGMGTARLRAYAEYGGDAVGRAAHGRLGLAKARTARCARGVGKRKAVQRQGVPRRADRWTKSGLDRRVRRRAGRPSWRPRRDTARVGARSGVPGKTFRTSPVPLRFSQDF